MHTLADAILNFQTKINNVIFKKTYLPPVFS